MGLGEDFGEHRSVHALPAVTIIASGQPCSSIAWWIVVIRPLRERPMP